MRHLRHKSEHHSSLHRSHRRHHRSSRRRGNGAFSGANAAQTGTGLCCIFTALGVLAFLVLTAIFKTHSDALSSIPEKALWFSSVPAILACAVGLYALLFKPQKKNVAQLVFSILLAMALLIFHLLEFRSSNTCKPSGNTADIQQTIALPTPDQPEKLPSPASPAQPAAAKSDEEKSSPVQQKETKAEDWYNGL